MASDWDWILNTWEVYENFYLSLIIKQYMEYVAIIYIDKRNYYYFDIHHLHHIPIHIESKL